MDQRAFEFIDLFLTACVSTDAQRDAMVRRVEGLKPLVTPIPPDQIEKLHRRPGGIGWTVKSPRGTVFVVDQDQPSGCNARNTGIDVQSIRILIRKFAEDVAKDRHLKFEVRQEGYMGPRNPNTFYQEYGLVGEKSLPDYLFAISTSQAGAQTTYATFAKLK